MGTVNIYTIDPGNIGDRCSAPLLYFKFPFPIEPVCMLSDALIDQNDNILFGGGGLLHFRKMESLVLRAKGALVSWGMGHNSHGGEVIQWPRYCEKFSIHGVRDWNTGLPWVPCASCMHSGFDATYPIEHEVVLYDHFNYKTGVRGLPTLDNSTESLDKVLAFLGSGAVVLTSSYHGAYWATLLGRKVIIIRPFSSKFFHFRHPPVISTGDRWKQDIQKAHNYPESLTECRKSNTEHFSRVCEFLDNSNRNPVKGEQS